MERIKTVRLDVKLAKPEKNKKKDKVRVVKYSLGEELINSITHGIGALLAIAALVLSLVAASDSGSAAHVVSAAIYGATMILMFTMSCIYHALSPRLRAKKVFRVIDHCDIFVFIAGSYTPYCLALIGGSLGYTIFGVIWGLAILGATLNAVNLDKFEKPSLALYLIMGWLIVFSFNSLKAAIAPEGLYLLIGGGVAYTVGALLYALGSKRKYLHSIFHFFVLLGCILQFFSIFLYVL